ncbi:unnamed protein product [Anisakis simplex]|uniref:Thymidine kinase n=1 Tax=Anisakis simplex TaxID=6269 RepID=A0A0M3K3C4_ANISI|nr:unnamed protein product [Anisakis simplex]
MQDCISSTTIRDIFEELVPHTVIAIDEGQFFPDIVECCEKLANMGKIVIVAALDGDYNRKEFDNHVLELCPLAEKVCKLRAVCTKCGGDAPFTKRLSDDTEQEVIGGLEKYQAMCRRCYLDEDKENCLAQHPPLQEIHAETPFCVSAVGLKRFKCDLPTHNC